MPRFRALDHPLLVDTFFRFPVSSLLVVMVDDVVLRILYSIQGDLHGLKNSLETTSVLPDLLDSPVPGSKSVIVDEHSLVNTVVTSLGYPEWTGIVFFIWSLIRSTVLAMLVQLWGQYGGWKRWSICTIIAFVLDPVSMLMLHAFRISFRIFRGCVQMRVYFNRRREPVASPDPQGEVPYEAPLSYLQQVRRSFFGSPHQATDFPQQPGPVGWSAAVVWRFSSWVLEATLDRLFGWTRRTAPGDNPV